MNELNAILQDVGNRSMDLVWFPLLIWSICALTVYLLLKIFKKNDVLYQYHTRVALVAGIPLGILAPLSTPFFTGLFTGSASPEQFSFIVVQNPISIIPQPDAVFTANWNDPNVWVGFATLIVVLAGIIQVTRLIWSYQKISRFADSLLPVKPEELSLNNSMEHGLNGLKNSKIRLAFSEEVDVPFTFGWRNPVIVIPSFLRGNQDKTALVIRHELMHIKNGDYLVNAFILSIKSIFWFHPLLYLFEHEIREYRELYCDTEVLADQSVSPKEYARLLFELAPARATPDGPALKMSVKRSTLMKRIQTMNLLNPKQSILRSLTISLALLAGLTGFIACSDLQTTGITSQDVEQFQSDMTQAPAENQPLYVLFEDAEFDGERDGEGEIWPSEEGNILSRVKSTYINNITVLKDESAAALYGERGQNGVIEITFHDKELALSDLNEPPPPQPATGTPDQQTASADQQAPPPAPDNEEDFYLVAEEPPRLINGIAGLMNQINYPEAAREAGMEGTVYVQFIVNELGEAEDPKVIRSVGGGLDEEALRVVRQARFEPGRQDGNLVRVRMSIPMVFRL